MPHTEQELLQLIATHGLISPKNSERSTSASPTTPATDEKPFDYWEWYNAPGNHIREKDEANGITLHKDPDGMLRFSADLKKLNPDTAQREIYPSYFRTRTFDKFSISLYSFQNHEIARQALEYSKKYVDNIDEIIAKHRGTGLYYYSQTKGSGKTYLSTMLGNELTNIGHRVLWYSMPNLLQEIKNSYDRESGASTADVIDRIKRVEILMLDDVGVERQTSWVNETVFSILDYRLMLGKPTIFTSNHQPDELSYDERIIDRIRSMTTMIPMPEENVRRRFASQNDLKKFLGG
jgi:DNA replication protein DnaC